MLPLAIVLCQMNASSRYPALTSGGVQYLPLACHVSCVRHFLSLSLLLLFMKLSNIKYRLQVFVSSFLVARTEYFNSVAVQVNKRFPIYWLNCFLLSSAFIFLPHFLLFDYRCLNLSMICFSGVVTLSESVFSLSFT